MKLEVMNLMTGELQYFFLKQMMLDGHSASTVSERLGIGNTNLLYRWKQEILAKGGDAATTLDAKVRELRDELRRVERERDILKKALAIFSQQE